MTSTGGIVVLFLSLLLFAQKRATGGGLHGEMQFFGKLRRGICLVLPHTSYEYEWNESWKNSTS